MAHRDREITLSLPTGSPGSSGSRHEHELRTADSISKWMFRCGVYAMALWGLYSVVAGVALPSVAQGNSEVLRIVVCVALVCMQQWCYYQSMFSDPGRLPPQPHLVGQGVDAEDLTDFHHVMKTAGMPKPKHQTLCNKCGAERPPGAHHCKRCEHCVQRFDHHCPVVGVCIAEGNHKFFMQFLLYTVLYCVFILANVAPHLWFFGGKLGGMYLAASIATLLVLLSQSSLCGFHLMITAYDMTTLEYIADKTRMDLTETKPRTWSLHNLRRMFGPSLKYWCLPVVNPLPYHATAPKQEFRVTEV